VVLQGLTGVQSQACLTAWHSDLTESVFRLLLRADEKLAYIGLCSELNVYWY
jgi:hypothetical protein